jgi:hypothetical protein
MSESPSTKDPFFFHRIALAPLVTQDPAPVLEQGADLVRNKNRELEFFSFLVRNDLAPLWHKTLHSIDAFHFFSPSFSKNLRQARMIAAANYLKQRHTLHKTGQILADSSIPHAVFKGAHIREIIYQDPAIRPACDIDILIHEQDKQKAVQTLVTAGMVFHPTEENISHEATLQDTTAYIDLHWNILRPGRTRTELTKTFLAETKTFSGHQGLNNEATLFIMLVHPVFTKYSTTPQASLVRMADLDRWLQVQETNWKTVYQYLDQAGLKTAAWITANWLAILTGTTLPASFVKSITPSPLKARYLRHWLTKNLATRLIDHPFLVQTGFTLPAHDTVSDSWRATRQIMRERKAAQQKTRELKDYAKKGEKIL